MKSNQMKAFGHFIYVYSESMTFLSPLSVFGLADTDFDRHHLSLCDSQVRETEMCKHLNLT